MGTKDWKTALVTGGVGGLGFELARQCAARGMDVALVGRNEERLVEAAAQLEFEHNIKAHVIVCDLAKVGAAAKGSARVREMGLVVDVLVNNAGFGYDARFVESDMARQRDLILTNDLALVELVGEFAPDMAERKCGGILNVASVAGFMPGPDMATYYASKAFVQSFSQAIHVELRRAGGKCRCSSHPDFADRARCPLRCERGIQRALPQQGPLHSRCARKDDRVRNAPCPARFRGEDGGSTPAPAQEEIGTRTWRLFPHKVKGTARPPETPKGEGPSGPRPPSVCEAPALLVDASPRRVRARRSRNP